MMAITRTVLVMLKLKFQSIIIVYSCIDLLDLFDSVWNISIYKIER